MDPVCGSSSVLSSCVAHTYMLSSPCCYASPLTPLAHLLHTDHHLGSLIRAAALLISSMTIGICLASAMVSMLPVAKVPVIYL